MNIKLFLVLKYCLLSLKEVRSIEFCIKGECARPFVFSVLVYTGKVAQ